MVDLRHFEIVIPLALRHDGTEAELWESAMHHARLVTGLPPVTEYGVQWELRVRPDGD